MRRILIGILALLFLAGAVAVYFQDLDNTVLLSVLLRVGLVLGAMWLAYDQVLDLSQRTPSWLLGCIGAFLAVLVVRPKAVWVAAPLIAAIAVLQFFGWLFKPLPNPRKSRRASGPPKDGNA